MRSRRVYRAAAVAGAAVLLAAAGLVAAPVLLERALASREVSRVGIPATDLTVVLTEDFKHLHSYQMFERGRPASDLRLLGPTRTAKVAPAQVTVSPGVATIRWDDAPFNHFVTIDLERFAVESDSNLAGAPPDLRTKP